MTELYRPELADQVKAIDQATIVAVTDRDGTIIYANQKFCEISGYERDELIGSNHRLINSGYHSKAFFKAMWEQILSGQIWKGEVQNRKKNGDFYWVDTTIIPIKKPTTDEITGFFSVRHEITALKLAQELILRQQEQAVSNGKFSAIGEMASAITHEINNPLAVILGRTEMLKNLLQQPNPDLGTILRMIETIGLNAHRIEKIVEAMRSYSHNSSGEKSITPVGEIIEQVLDLCAERFRSSGIDLKVSLPSQPTFTLCDGTQAFQILLNLLNNSFDAIKQTKDPWVDMTVRKNFDSGMIDFVITDSGLGIDPLLQDKIFYPFFSTKEKKYGTGIGLSLSQNLAEKNNGSLRIDKNSKNTRFILSLPSVS